MQASESTRIHPWYVTGFVEGAGCFTFSRNGTTLALYFAMKGTAAERSVLEEVREFFAGAGQIYALGAAATTDSAAPGDRGVLYYRITRLSDLRAVVDHLDRYPLRGAKARAFEVWREMFELKCAHLRRSSSGRLDELAGRLSSLSRRNRRASDVRDDA